MYKYIHFFVSICIYVYVCMYMCVYIQKGEKEPLPPLFPVSGVFLGVGCGYN